MDFKDSHGNSVNLPKNKEVAWRVSGYAIIKNKKGHVLMVQSGSGLWHFPGGGIELGEAISAGIRRECLEETGYKITVEPIVRHINEQYFYHKREQAFYHSIQLFFTGNVTDSTPDPRAIKSEDAARKVSWINLADVPIQHVHETVRELVTKLNT